MTEATAVASVTQTRHRFPKPLRFLEPSEVETDKIHSLEDYGLMHVNLYEDISQNVDIATGYAYPQVPQSQV